MFSNGCVNISIVKFKILVNVRQKLYLTTYHIDNIKMTKLRFVVEEISRAKLHEG